MITPDDARDIADEAASIADWDMVLRDVDAVIRDAAFKGEYSASLQYCDTASYSTVGFGHLADKLVELGWSVEMTESGLVITWGKP